MEEEEVDIIIETEEDKSFLLQVPKIIKCSDLKKIIEDKKLFKKRFYIIFRNKICENNEILNINSGETIYLECTIVKENYTACNFHKNLNLNEADMVTCKLSGILHLCLLKYISRNIKDTSKIQNKEIKGIIEDLQKDIKFTNDPEKDIKSVLEQNNGNNIITYMHYLEEVIKEKDIENLISLFDSRGQKDIKGFWSILSKYQDFNLLFERDFSKSLEKSYFDYSLISVSIFQHKRRKEFLENIKKCSNCQVKYLFHGTEIGPIANIMTEDFRYTRQAFYGMGIYFTDMIDYATFYCGGINEKNERVFFSKVLPIGQTISCVASEVYFDKTKKKNIFDSSYYVETLDHWPTYQELKTNYPDKMVEENGIHFIRVEPTGGDVYKSNQDIQSAREIGKFIGTEYVITEKKQILPLYGITLKRNEYFVIWSDPNFKGKNHYSDYLKDRKMFIYKEAKMNVFFESSTEKALELIRTKKHNKIILISSIGKSLAGKKFIEIARKILGFNVMVLFFSGNRDHLSWIENFPNALYTDNDDFYEKYIKNYNKEGLLKLKKEIEDYYDIHLKFTKDFLDFPNFAVNKRYDELYFEEKCPYFRKVIIKSKKNKKALYMDEKGIPKFVSLGEKENEDIIWYVTIIDGEITLFSKGFYLDMNEKNKKIKSFEYMVSWKYEEIFSKYFIYFKDKNNVLTIDGDNALIKKENAEKNNQLFVLVDILK